MQKSLGTTLLVAALATSSTFLARPSSVLADAESVLPDFYSEPGFHQWRDEVSTVNESIDPFSGSLRLSYVDMVVPGNGGLDIVVRRTYSSNIWLSRPNPWSIAPTPTVLLPRTPTGVGWTIHFGRVVRNERDPSEGPDFGICAKYNSEPGDTTLNNGVLELPDGSQATLAVSATEVADFITQNNWVANCKEEGNGLIVHSPDGLKYTMDHLVAAFEEVTYTTRTNRAWYPTRIEDGNGNFKNTFRHRGGFWRLGPIAGCF